MYSVRNLKTFEGQEGIGMNVDLLENGIKIAHVRDDAWGGPYNFVFVSKEVEDRFNAFIKTLPSFEFQGMTLDMDGDIYISQLVDSFQLRNCLIRLILTKESIVPTLVVSKSNCYELRAAINNATRELESLQQTMSHMCTDSERNKHYYAFKLIQDRVLELILKKIACENVLKAKPFKFGGRVDGEDASWINFWVFPVSYTDDQIETILSDEGCDIEGHHAEWAGQPFIRSISIYRGVGRVLVTQSGGLDI